MALRLRARFVQSNFLAIKKARNCKARFSMELLKLPAVLCWHVIIPSKKAKTVKPRQRNKGIYDAANNRFHAAKNGGYKVEPKQANEPPINCPNYYKR